jgi:hypothetical protein
MHRLVAPSVRLFAATVILITGAGLSAVFLKMPNGAECHALYHEGIVNQDLAAVPLPSDSVAVISHDEMLQMDLPMLDSAPVADSGAPRYAQVYEAPPSLVAYHSERNSTVSLIEEESAMPDVLPTFEPVRKIVVEKPIIIEPVNKDFQPKPASVSTTEKSDELLMMFHFVENSREDFGYPAESVQPADPFPIAVTSTLRPLIPLNENLSPLLPLPESELQTFLSH